MNVITPWIRKKMPITKMNTSTDWNGVRSRTQPTMIEITPRIALSTRLPVSPSRLNEPISEKIPLTNSQAAKKMLIVTIVAPG